MTCSWLSSRKGSHLISAPTTSLSGARGADTALSYTEPSSQAESHTLDFSTPEIPTNTTSWILSLSGAIFHQGIETLPCTKVLVRNPFVLSCPLPAAVQVTPSDPAGCHPCPCPWAQPSPTTWGHAVHI